MKNLLSVGVLLSALAAGATYAPEAWDLEARQKFAEQRFGIFIHWGLYANYAQGEWYLQHNKLDEKAYSRMMEGFYPSRFNAEEWVSAFRKAGAKYVTITSRHHDGFSLWPTKVDDGYNIANTPFGRDILGELAAACRKEGLQLNFYYSLMDWHRGDYPSDRGKASKGIPGHEEQKGDYASYKKFMLGQIGELIARYHPGNIWFDGEWDHATCRNGVWERDLDWQFDDIYDFIHARHTLVANNNHQPIRPKEDIQLFERDLPGENAEACFSKNQPLTDDRPVEQCDVIQNDVWGYRIGETRFRSPEDVVALVARAASKGANLLLNIGPDGSGRLPARAVEVLEGVGAWFARNGESIYATDGCPIARGKDIVATRKGAALYLHFLTPGVDEIGFKLAGELASAIRLADGAAVPVAVRDGVATVRLARPEGCAGDVVVKLLLK